MLFTILICAVNFESYTVFFVSNMIFYPYDLLLMGWQAAPKIITFDTKCRTVDTKGRGQNLRFHFLIETDIFR